MSDKSIKYHLALSDPGTRSPLLKYTYITHIYLATKEQKALIQVHKTLETSKEDNVHH